jgi:hypothetical protein
VISEGLGRKAKISVLKTFSLTKEKAKISPSRRASTSQPITRPTTPHLQAANRGTPTVKPRPSLPPPLPQQPEHPKPLPQEIVAPSELTSLKTWAENAITSQQRDIERIAGTVERIEKGMQSFREFMEEVRTELASNRQVQSHPSEEDLVLVHEDLNRLRQQVKSHRAETKSSSGQVSELSSHRLERIVEDVHRVSDQASEVDDLKTELEQLKARLHQIEDGARTGIPPSSPTLKRKRSQIYDENNSEDHDTSPELPAKRQRIRNSTESTVVNSSAVPQSSDNENRNFPLTSSDNHEAPDMQPPTSNKRLVIEIKSSDPDTSLPRHSQYYERGEFVYEDEDIDDDYRPNSPNNKLINSVSTWSRPKRRASSTAIPNTPMSAPTSAPRALRSRVAPEPGRPNYGVTPRITFEGKIDGRSLRFKKQALGQLSNNATASPGPDSPLQGTVRPSDTRVSSSPAFVKPMIPLPRARQPAVVAMTPSFETRPRGSSGMSSSIPHPPQSFSQSTPKPFKCGGCGARYGVINSLQYHKQNSSSSACKSSENDEIPTEFKCSECSESWKTLAKYSQVCLSPLVSHSLLFELS